MIDLMPSPPAHLHPTLRGLVATGVAAGDGPASEASEACSRLRMGGMRILIVEDEVLLAMDLQMTFEDEGAEVVGPALSLDHALAEIAGNAVIDGAVLDVDLAGREIYPVAVLLRERGIPFVFHTGHGSRTRLAEMFPGAITCTKPTSPETLIASLLRLTH